MFYQDFEGVDCFDVGIRQFGYFCITDGPRLYIEGCGENDYVFVVCWPNYRNGKIEFVARGSRDFMLDFANGYHQAAVSRIDIPNCDVPIYEVWHLVDDGDLWQAWEHDAELSRVDAPVLLDERDIDDVEVDHEQLWSLYVPSLGRVSFLWHLRNGELVEEYVTSNWQSDQPIQLLGTGWYGAGSYDWQTVEEMLHAAKFYEMLCDAAPLDGGGRVGADF